MIKTTKWFLVLSLCALQSCTHLPGQADNTIHSDLDGDGKPEIVRVEKVSPQSSPQPLIRLSITENGDTRYQELFPGWKVLSENIDNKPGNEILIALSKVDYRDKALRNRLYAYKWNNGLHDMWRGSRFPRAFIDFDIKKSSSFHQSVLRLLEIDSGKHLFYISRYRWLHFGFAKMDERQVKCNFPFPENGLDSWYRPGALKSCG